MQSNPSLLSRSPTLQTPPEVKIAIAGQSSFPIAITRAIAHWDVSTSRGHVFLVPSLGGEAIDALHQRLYHGALRSHRRPEIPYIPHVTIAQKTSRAGCVELSDALSRTCRRIDAAIAQVHVVSVTTDAVTSVRVFDLERPGLGTPA